MDTESQENVRDRRDKRMGLVLEQKEVRKETRSVDQILFENNTRKASKIIHKRIKSSRERVSFVKNTNKISLINDESLNGQLRIIDILQDMGQRIEGSVYRRSCTTED